MLRHWSCKTAQPTSNDSRDRWPNLLVQYSSPSSPVQHLPPIRSHRQPESLENTLQRCTLNSPLGKHLSFWRFFYLQSCWCVRIRVEVSRQVARLFAAGSLSSPSVISSAVDPGAGFNLALDYGTASVWYANGTAVDIVKIEGGPAYKHFMHSVTAEFRLDVPENDWGQQKLGFMPFQDYLPTWATAKPVNPNADAITWMIKGLKAATEAYVEEPMTAVRISIPFTISRGSSFDSTMRTAVESLGLDNMGVRLGSTAITSIYDLEGECDLNIYPTPDHKTTVDDPERIYLAIDYSRAGISAFLVSEECNVTEILRKFYNTSLGADANFAGMRNQLSRSLEDLTRRPFDDLGYTYPSELSELLLLDNLGSTYPSKISELVLLGESADNAMLHEILEEVLGRDYTALKAASDKRADVHLPIFAGSRAVAMQVQAHQEYISTRVWDEQRRDWMDKDVSEKQHKRWWS
ncbi:hypothetical protein D6D20_03174 [Aureobasidium pullulans]|uniref:Actin-like ATPase domain-containing protein n=1 Tax=Aureobasidium pullulans TaxID=5580 RepID=A0A4V4INX9_AURPU|nr:hypothetical protein D6D20_03174 [Aureobasidium pullulans]